MKVELIVAVVLTSLSIGERQQRSTVLTDESKRILEHFDFSNFDKQEALNYLDRQRYENQIRGKRSQAKIKKDQEKSDGKAQDLIDSKLGSEKNFSPNSQLIQIKDLMKQNKLPYSEFIDEICKLKQNSSTLRNKRGHHYKRKHKPKIKDYSEFDEDLIYDEDEEEERRYRKRKRKKKKKRHYWDRWSEWSPCSVTCGRGRKIRWRKCIAKNCTIGELEMGEKTCQLPACNLLTKLLGLK